MSWLPAICDKDSFSVTGHGKLPEFQESGLVATISAFFIGTAIIGAAILLGRSHALYIAVMAIALGTTMIWKKLPRPWIFLASMAAATPIPMLRQQFAPNLFFALWLLIFNWRFLSELPRWVYIPFSFAVFGVITSSFSWMSSNIFASILRQGAFAFNFLFAPCILLPLIYFRVTRSKDHTSNLKGLLFFLILPSTLLLVSARFFGSLANEWQASLHAQSHSEGYMLYQLGKVLVSLVRTEIGFILAALICASTSVVAVNTKSLYRFVAAACLVANLFLLLSTGSFGSSFSCLCGLSVIFLVQITKINPIRVIAAAMFFFCLLSLTYAFSPPNIKAYLTKRYEHRVVDKDTDRIFLWQLAIEYFLEHPGGVGFTATVGESVKSNPHNDYLLYSVSYGFSGGIAFLSLIGGLLIGYFRRRKRTLFDPDGVAVYAAGFGVLIAFAVNSVFDNGVINRWYFNVIWSIIWYCYFCSSSEKTEGNIDCNTAENGISQAPEWSRKSLNPWIDQS